MVGFETRDVARMTESGSTRREDLVAIESALSISVNDKEYGLHNIGLTMRTKGEDQKLVLGFLYSEGIIDSIDQIIGVDSDEESVVVTLGDGTNFDPKVHCRPSIVSSACGICGRKTIDESLKINTPELDEQVRISMNSVARCLHAMKSEQPLFASTGGSHACASFDGEGVLQRIYEDVGRHNAMDKLVGSYLSDRMVPINGLALFVSGRASFELVQKSIRAGFPIMVAIGAPSTLAVDLANEHGKTLICFAKSDSITVYSGVRRVVQ